MSMFGTPDNLKQSYGINANGAADISPQPYAQQQQSVKAAPVSIGDVPLFSSAYDQNSPVTPGRVRDINYRIPVIVNNAVEIWEYSTRIESDIDTMTYVDHCITLPKLISAWGAAYSTYQMLIQYKKNYFSHWIAQEINRILAKGFKFRSETEKINMVKAECGATYLELEDEIVSLEANCNVIKYAILDPLDAKLEVLKTLGFQMRVEKKDFN